ncbi:MAG TPA: TonB-dependent receptor [Pyrinomonadaceae bacterium]|nr:TonB-dependent receptor [Pyrinomonadaceae bacterium]
MSVIDRPTAVVKLIVAMLVVAWVGSASAHAASVTVTVTSTGNLGVIKGMVRDDGGSPIADATVAIFKAGTTRVLKQVRSAADGSFVARILPGTYTIFAVATGFNPITLADVQINGASQLTYGFKLERAGSGNTLPERRVDRNNPKWVIRSAQTSRSIYQNAEGSTPAVNDRVTVEETSAGLAEREESGRRGQTVAETYFAGSDQGNYAGVNFATFLPVSDDADVVLAGQAGVGRNAPQRFEIQTKFRPTDSHQIRLTSSIGSLGSFMSEGEEKSLGQFSLQASDEWKIREGVIVVLGVDYARFIGGGDDSSISPRFGLQFDINAKTRFRSAFTTHTEERTWSKAIDLEDSQVTFRDPVSIDDFVVESGKPILNKSNRLEFGVERVLDNNSSIEANAFFDTTLSRGVGLAGFAYDAPSAPLTEFVGNQQGEARGFRLVYSRRIGSRFSTAAGYSVGIGQKLSEDGITNPADLFENGFFQTFYGQFEADLKSGTNVKTIFRLSPQATVFAIDPFQGRLAIYDPSLSILVTQNLPTLGLPFHAEAVVDARNLFDFQSGAFGEEGSLRLNAHRRAVRGSILVRF